MATSLITQNLSPQAVDFPDLYNGRAVVNPPRNGMDRYTGKMLSGWNHVEQSLEMIFLTSFHTRVLRRWVGSFVRPILGRNIDVATISRFYWAMISAIDLWEPDYRITNVRFMQPTNNGGAPLTAATLESLIRGGQGLFAQTGTYYPRGHLGDYTPAQPLNNLFRLPSVNG